MVTERLHDWPTRLLTQTERLGHRPRHQPGIGPWGQFHQPYAVGVAADDSLRDRQGEPGLPYPAGANQGHQPVGREQFMYYGLSLFATNKTGQRGGQVVRWAVRRGLDRSYCRAIRWGIGRVLRDGQRGGALLPGGQRQCLPLLGSEGERVGQPEKGGGIGPAQATFEIEEAPRTHARALGKRLLRQTGDFPVSSEEIPNRLVCSGRLFGHTLSCCVCRRTARPSPSSRYLPTRIVACSAVHP